MKESDFQHRSLEYHEHPRPGKTSIQPTKPFASQDDLSLAYTPGVAGPVEAIAANPDDAYRYTNKGNLVGVVTNGSAVLGLGDVGAVAGKPVMEGKAVLFKLFADIDVFDIEVDTHSNEAFIETVTAIAPTFGGINLEDIAAPQCFAIEEALKERLDIPVFHDDQHGTAIVVSAGLINALELQGKRIEDVNIVILGAGAAGIATAKLLITLGARRDHLVMVDSHGVIQSERTDLNVYKHAFAINTPLRTIGEAMLGADVLIGLSGPGTISQEMIKTMSSRSIVFALSNPDPEIYPEEIVEVRPQTIVATGRSDYPNQVNNSLVFPFVFRAALDGGLKRIEPWFLKAAVNALAGLAREEVPSEVLEAYGVDNIEFGPDYILPKQFDPRLRECMVNGMLAAIPEGG